jgi:hypothetical protein
MEKFLSERKTAIRLGISRMSLRKYRRAGIIKPLAIEYAVLYPFSEIESFMARYVVRKGKSLQTI